MITLAITTYNRTELLYESFEHVIDDPRISEVVIVDDSSPLGMFTDIEYHFRDKDKVKLFRNDRNLDCYYNKREAVRKSSNEWVILLDSDNIITKNYLDRIDSLFISGLNPKTVYQPSFAKPHFKFTSYEGILVDKSNVNRYMDDPTFGTMLNAMNYFVNRDEFLRVWDGTVNPVTSDSIFQNYNWLNSGNSIYVVPDLEYEHRVHTGSHYQNNVRRTPRGFHDEIVNKLKALR